jgi:hypothetical protein
MGRCTFASNLAAEVMPGRDYTSSGHDWMKCVSCAEAPVSRKPEHSLPLAAFDSDSLVEPLSACIVLLQFRRGIRVSALAAARLASVLLVLSAGVVMVLAILTARFKIVPKRSFLGTGITLGALIMMPILAFLKRRCADRTNNHALAALLSLMSQTIHAAWWIDSVAALCLIPILLMHGKVRRVDVAEGRPSLSSIQPHQRITWPKSVSIPDNRLASL